ncbi:MFS transporter [Thermoleophilia bacterium SCSIO 60948]|nr:MFS transporter [Thermoleophilia bacterium SCSIO 60948]
MGCAPVRQTTSGDPISDQSASPAKSASGAGGSSAKPGFLRRVTAATAFGEGLDGYDLGVISVVIPIASGALGMSTVEEGLLGASSLAGIFFGAPIFGWLTDRIGRRKIFIFDLIALMLLGAAQLFVQEVALLIALRFGLGLAIGAEYAIGQPMLAELVPSKGRGRRLASLQTSWYGGFLLAVIVGYSLDAIGVDWRWILASGALPALITLLMRRGLPESPHWLASQGREKEAREIVDENLGEDYYEDEDLDDAVAEPAPFRDLFRKDMWRTTAFASIFFACFVGPYFAIFTFAPEVFSSLGFEGAKISIIATNAIAFAGALVGMFVIERIGRRKILLTSFWVMLVSITVIGVWSGGPAAVLLGCLVAFAFFNAISGDLVGVYPPEVFPAELRGSGVGFSSAMSRVAAAGGTFLLPIGIAGIGIGPTFLICAAFVALGLWVTWLWAPNTEGMSLAESGEAVGAN